MARLCLLFALALAPRPAEAGLGSLVKAAAKAGKLAKGAGTGTKAGAAAGTAMLASRGVRSANAFALLPDDAGKAAAYLARDGDDLALVGRAGDEVTASESALSGVVDDMRLPDEVEVTLVLDPEVATRPPDLGHLEDVRLYAADGTGQPHPVVRDSTGELMVDVGGNLIDLADFGASALDAGGFQDDGPDYTAMAISLGSGCSAFWCSTTGARRPGRLRAPNPVDGSSPADDDLRPCPAQNRSPIVKSLAGSASSAEWRRGL